MSFNDRFPTHQGRHICKAHKAETQKPTLQKSLPCSYASSDTPYFGWHKRYNDTPDRRRTYNMGLCAIAGRRNAASTFCSLLCGISSLSERCWSAVVNINKNNYFHLQFGAWRNTEYRSCTKPCSCMQAYLTFQNNSTKRTEYADKIWWNFLT